MTGRLELIALQRFPLVEPGDDLAQVIVASLRDSLKPGGTLDIATDSDDYVAEILEVVAEVGGLVAVPDARPGVGGVAGDRPTVFEERWRAMGRTIHFHRYQKES